MSEHAYMDHGRRHGPDGSDPIPGLSTGTGLQYATCMNGTDTTISATTTSYVSAGAGDTTPHAAEHFYTNAPDIFTFAKKTVSTVDYWGIVLNQFGNYLVAGTVVPFVAPSSGVIYEAVQPDFANTGFPALSMFSANFQTGDGAHTRNCVDAYLNVFDGPVYSNTIPSDPLVWKVQNYGSSSIRVFVNVTVILLPGTTATSIL